MKTMGNINNEASLQSYIAENKRQLVDEISDYNSVSDGDLPQIEDQLFQKYRMKPIEFEKVECTEPYEIRNSNGYQDQRGFVYRIDVKLSFKGDSKLFYLYPATSSAIKYLRPEPEITENSVKFYFELRRLNKDGFQEKLDNYLRDLKSNIPAINLEVENWNNYLKEHIKELLNQRINILKQKNDFIQD